MLGRVLLKLFTAEMLTNCVQSSRNFINSLYHITGLNEVIIHQVKLTYSK